MKTYTVITTGASLDENSPTYARFGEWTFADTHNDGELYTVEVSDASAPAFEVAALVDPVIVGFEAV